MLRPRATGHVCESDHVQQVPGARSQALLNRHNSIDIYTFVEIRRIDGDGNAN